MKGLRDIIRELLQEDDEAKQKGWKHIAFGTYEDPSGNRFRKDSTGSWQPVGPKSATTAPMQSPANPMADYEKRVRELEDEGLETSDAQGVADVEFMKKYGRGWETR